VGFLVKVTTPGLADLARTWLRLAGDLESAQALTDLLNDFEREPEKRAG
jgi:hypothetical protein